MSESIHGKAMANDFVCGSMKRWAKRAVFRLSLFRDVNSAARVDHHGCIIEDLAVDNGQILVDLKPNEISYIDANL